MDRPLKDRHDDIRKNCVERDEDEMPGLNGAVLHVLSSNGMTNCDSARCGVIQKGKIIKNNEMGKKRSNHIISVAKTKVCHNLPNSNCLTSDQKVNGLDDSHDSHGKLDEIPNDLTKKIQNGLSTKLNGLNSPSPLPVKLEEQRPLCNCNKTKNGDINVENESTLLSKNQIVRPKSISWSRMVKQRKENKMKERNGRNCQKRKKGYIYPELCTSSEESSDENVKLSDKEVDEPEQSIKSLCNQSLQLYGHHSNGRNSTDNLMPTVKHEAFKLPQNRENGLSGINYTEYRTMGVAPLAIPEDSDTGRSSISSNSDTKISESVTENNINEIEPEDNLSMNVTEMNKTDHNLNTHTNVSEDNRVLERNILPMLRNPSVDSLEEIGDYIETDFPSKASRLLFQSSSRSSSPSTDDEDEGYGVNKSKDNMPFTTEQSYNPISSGDNSSSHKLNSDNMKLNTNQTHKPGFENISQCARRISRLSSGAGSESEKAGILGSDSSYVYTPETDYQEFIDSDLPSSEANNQYAMNNDKDYDPSQMENYAEEIFDSDSNLHHNNELIGAEGGATNNLNLEGRRLAFEYLDSNMEVYDPHCDQPDDDNYLLRVIYKHEKVPIANFQDSESNKQEKIFFKHALDGENPASLSGSSDEEENAFHNFPPDIQNPSLNSDSQNNDSVDCMGVEDLENLTHALQNAVIMHLPSRLEESSGESSEEPIYEEIDNLDSFLSTSDNSLHVVEEEQEHGSETSSKVNTLPKYERRRRKGHRGSDIDKVMIWNEYEAYVLQVKQIGSTACGHTAVLNIMKAFDYQVDKEEVCKKLTTNYRMEAAPIPYYLFSRYNAGTTEDALIEGVDRLTKGTIRGRFFHFYPARNVELLKWLGYWMRKGAVPLATLNLQRGVKPGWTIPDGWHHQMIYGVSSKGVYLTNPLEIVPEETIMEQLTSDSVLLIRRQDVVNRFRDWAPLNEFLKKSDTRWLTMNVLGQVVNVLREACTALSHQGPRYRAQLTSHITIPAAYKAGITLFVRQNTEVCQELFNASELELKHPEVTED